MQSAAASAARKNLSGFRNPLCPSPQLASFHGTPISLAKWKSKWDSKGNRKGQQPSKTYVRYSVRQKRAEIKKALKDYLLFGKSSHLLFQSDELNCCPGGAGGRNFGIKNKSNTSDYTSPPKNSGKPRSHSSPSPGKTKYDKSKFWQNRSHDGDDYNEPESIYEAVFGGHGGFRWSFAWDNFYYKTSRSQFEWEEDTREEKDDSRDTSDSDTESNTTEVGSNIDRITLGLPPRGPLKLDDVKSAFRLSALKWHPDKHQGPSQAMAAEKFRICVDAYNSLCSDLKGS